MRRRRALKLMTASMVSTCAFSLEGLSQDEPPSLTVVFTGDLHGHVEPWLGWEGQLAGKMIGGYDRIARAVNQIRRQAGRHRVLLLDSGDAIGDTLLASETRGRAIIDLMNQLGYDAMTIGNHEPDYSAQTLRQRIQQARFPVLAANLQTEQGDLFSQPFLLRKINGISVGILGLAYPNTPLTTSPKNVRGLVFKEVVATASEYIPRLRQAGAQVVIALTHYGLGADLKLAERVPGIDLIIGGHSHNRTHQPHRVGQTMVLHAGAHGSDVGRIDLYLGYGKIFHAKSQLVLLDNAVIPSQAEFKREMDRLLAPFHRQMNDRLAIAREPIIRAQTMAGPEPRKRNEESPADSLFADALREKTGSDMAFLPGVGYGVAMAKGPITSAQLRNLIPHDSEVVSLSLSGQQISEILEQAVHNTYTDDPREKVGGMIQVSGIEFSYRPAEAQGGRVRQVRVGGQPLARDQRYRVTTNSMLAQGGHNYTTFTQGANPDRHGSQFELIKQWLQEKGAVQAPAAGRIRQV